jgi:thiol-disulfide isomerase/thioredoxin
VKVRRRLLVISLLVSALVSAGIIWAIARNTASSNGDTVVIPSTGVFKPPTIGTNAHITGTPLAGVSLRRLDGTAVDTRSLTGTPLVINVWGSTCSPCKQELPAFAKVSAKYGTKVKFVGIDYLGASSSEEQFARSRGVTYELLYDGDGVFVTKVGIATFPVTLFVKADGTVVKQTGLLDEAKLTALIESNLL